MNEQLLEIQLMFIDNLKYDMEWIKIYFMKHYIKIYKKSSK